MNRRSFLAWLTASAAAIAVEQRLGPFGYPRIFGGDYDHGAGLWTPDVPGLATLPPPIDVQALLSSKRVLRDLTRRLDALLPKNGRQVILPLPGQTFVLGDTVFAADLTPRTGHTPVLLASYAILDEQVGCTGGLSMATLGRCESELAANLLLDHWLDDVAQQLAFHIGRRGINTFAPMHLAHVPSGTEGATIVSTETHLALRSWRYYDEATRAHEFRFDILGARV